MSKELKSLSIKELIEDKSLCSKVINLMQQHQTYTFILQYLESKGYKMARGNLTNFKNKVEEARVTGVPLEELADLRKKKSIKQVDPKKISGFGGNMNLVKTSQEQIKEATGSHNFVNEIRPKDKTISNAQVLEDIINKGFDTLQEMDTVDTATTLKAVEMYQKYMAKDTRGLSQEALKQYQVIMQARISAISEVIMQYVPNEKQEEAINALEAKEQEILANLGATKETQKLLMELKKSEML